MLTLQEAVDLMHTIREHLPHIDAHVYHPFTEVYGKSLTFIAIKFDNHCVATLDHPFDLHRLYQFAIHLVAERI